VLRKNRGLSGSANGNNECQDGQQGSEPYGTLRREVQLQIPTDWIANAHSAASPKFVANLHVEESRRTWVPKSQIQIVATAASLAWRGWGERAPGVPGYRKSEGTNAETSIADPRLHRNVKILQTH
jgi:hypothetical protein